MCPLFVVYLDIFENFTLKCRQLTFVKYIRPSWSSFCSNSFCKIFTFWYSFHSKFSFHQFFLYNLYGNLSLCVGYKLFQLFWMSIKKSRKFSSALTLKPTLYQQTDSICTPICTLISTKKCTCSLYIIFVCSLVCSTSKMHKKDWIWVLLTH